MSKFYIQFCQLTAALLLAVIEVNSQQSGSIRFSLVEGQKAGTPVGNVVVESGIEDTVTADVFDQLEYQILGSSDAASYFTIESRSGELSTNAMIDRETVCAESVTCDLVFDVTVKQDLAVIRLLTVIVTIEDINDNPPAFTPTEQNLSILESAQPGSEIPIDDALDADTGLGAEITYWMDDSDVFELRENKLLVGSELWLVLLQDLDREVLDSYHLKVYARDGSTSTSLTGSVSLTITVTDVNDHKPEFTQSVFNFTVKESAAVGSLVGVVNATDEDEGANGQVSFHFSSQTSSSVTKLFSLDENSGEVRVYSDLQYESGQTFEVVVEAKDHGDTPQAAQAVLVLSVADAGNTPPRLAVTLQEPLGGQDQDSTRLAEDLPIGSFVGSLKYEDKDEGENGEVSCASLNSHFTLQPLDENSYSIEIKSKLDRETQSEILVVLMCTDGGEPSLSSLANFTVFVDDANDNAPIFDPSDYTAHVSEMVSSQPSIVRVTATDADTDIDGNDIVTYQLTANSSNAFSVDPFTGWISLIAPVDRESGPVIYLTAIAVDGGSPTMTGSVTISVFVDDINDNAPEVVRFEYQARENQDPGAYVAQIAGSDDDDGINGELSYRLLEDPSSGFLVSETGIISTARVFDRETVNFYTFVVEVSDRGDPPLSSTATLTVTITDSNDHSPQIVYPVPGNDTVTLSAELSPGTVVAKAIAKDADVDQNAQLLYLIAEGNPTRIFSIDNTTGTIFLAKRLTTSWETSHRLTISVQDSGSPRLHNSSFLYLIVDFTNTTLDGQGDDENQHKYVVIAGVIAGVTLVIAIIVIATILKLRHMDITDCAGRGAKVKAGHAPMPPAPTPAPAPVKLSGPLAVYGPDQGDKDAGFGDDRFTELRSHQPAMLGTFSGYGGFTQVNPFAAGRDEMVEEKDGNQAGAEASPPPGSEDLTSDSSADVTTSDSGRGGSDTEDTPSSGALPSSSGRPIYGAVYSPSDQAPGVPPRQPVGETSFQEGPWLQAQGGSQDLSSLGCLPRSARAYASHKDFPKSRRPVGKVRFSMDDQEVGKTFEPPRVYYTGNPQAQASRPGNPSWQNQGRMNPQPQPFGHLGPDTNRGGASELGGLNPPPPRPARPSYPRQALHNLVLSRSPIPPTPSTSSASSPPSSQPDLFRGLHNNSNISNNNSFTSDVMPRQQQQQPKLAPPPSRSAPPPSNFPLLPHQRPQQPRPALNRGLLPTHNASVDEDDDDGGSTTTSGSYAVEDNILNISVEC